jgi:intracellular sulfur oxidation DsrE/DsrF family protein
MRNADPVPVTNPMKVPAANNGQHSLPELEEKGVQFAVCSRATRRMAGAIATATGATVDAVYAELAAGLIPNSRLVPAGFIAATRAQEMGYGLLFAE